MKNNLEKLNNSAEHLNLKEDLRQAIARKDLDAVLGSLENINDRLIGQRGTYNLPEADRLEILRLFEAKFASVKIYLGDGGLSRLVIEKDGDRIDLWIGLSSDDEEIKKKWDEI